MRVIDVVVAVFVLALVAMVWAVLAIVQDVRRSRRRARRLREDESFASGSLGLGLINSRIDLIPEAPELSFRDPESPAVSDASAPAILAAEPESAAEQFVVETVALGSSLSESVVVAASLEEEASSRTTDAEIKLPDGSDFLDAQSRSGFEAVTPEPAMAAPQPLAPTGSISDETAAVIASTTFSAPFSWPTNSTATLPVSAPVAVSPSSDVAPVAIPQAAVAQPVSAVAPVTAVPDIEEDGEWETSLLRTLSGGDRALLARAKMSEAWEETAMPDFVMPSRSFPSAIVTPRGQITSTLFGEPFTFEPLRSQQLIARGAETGPLPKPQRSAGAPKAQPQVTWSPTPLTPEPAMAVEASAAVVTAAAAFVATPAASSFGPPVLAILRTLPVPEESSARAEAVPKPQAHDIPADQSATQPVTFVEPNVAPARMMVPVLARAASSPEVIEVAPTTPEPLVEAEELQPLSAIFVPVMARGLPQPAMEVAETALTVEEVVPLPATVATAPAWPLVLSRTAYTTGTVWQGESSQFTHAEVPSAVADLAQINRGTAAPHSGIALPPAPLAHPAEETELRPATSSFVIPASAPASSFEAEDDSSEPVIAPTFPVSHSFGYQPDSGKSDKSDKTVPFRVQRPAPPLVRPQQAQTVTGAIAALREAGMDSGMSHISRAPRLGSPSQIMPPGPAFHRVAPKLAANSSGRHLVAPLRRPDLSSYYSKDLGDLSDPVAPRGRNREPRTPEEQKRQA
ncbi:hypothetical protein [Bryocella elongata]|nr:hypothetical protein [Bryocella elongata]